MSNENKDIRVELEFIVAGVEKDEAASFASSMMNKIDNRVNGYSCGTAWENDPDDRPRRVEVELNYWVSGIEKKQAAQEAVDLLSSLPLYEDHEGWWGHPKTVSVE